MEVLVAVPEAGPSPAADLTIEIPAQPASPKTAQNKKISADADAKWKAKPSRWSKRRMPTLNPSGEEQIPPSELARMIEEERLRREEEERQRKLMEAAMKEASGEAAADEPAEVAEISYNSLEELRESQLPQKAYVRYRVAEENRQFADQGRALSGELLSIKEEQEAAWASYGRERVLERNEGQRRTRKLRQELLRQRSREVQSARGHAVAARKLLAERQHQQREALSRRCASAPADRQHHEARLEEAHARERQDGARRRDEVAKAVLEVRLRLRTDNQMRVLRSRNPPSAKEHTWHQSSSTSSLSGPTPRRRAQEKREASRVLGAERERREVSYVERAHANRERAFATRAAAKAAVSQTLLNRKKMAAKERANAQLVAAEKARIITSNKQDVAAIYRARYASHDQAVEFESSPWRSIYGVAAQWLQSSVITKKSTPDQGLVAEVEL
jgi:hypothetical protein